MKINKSFQNIIIYSGGQTGVDRAALDFCIENNIKHKGYCPKGRLAEDGIIDLKYNLIETKTTDYSERTLLNVIHSDITLIIYDIEMDKGTKLTENYCIKNSKKYLKVNLNITSKKELVKLFCFSKINIAGPRESSSPGIYSKAYTFLNQLFTKLKT